jgi:hypothetical protein
MPSVDMLSVNMLNVVAPFSAFHNVFHISPMVISLILIFKRSLEKFMRPNLKKIFLKFVKEFKTKKEKMLPFECQELNCLCSVAYISFSEMGQLNRAQSPSRWCYQSQV